MRSFLRHVYGQQDPNRLLRLTSALIRHLDAEPRRRPNDPWYNFVVFPIVRQVPLKTHGQSISRVPDDSYRTLA
jgi:hypothetical protein